MSWNSGPCVGPYREPTVEESALRMAHERRVEEMLAGRVDEDEKVDASARWPGHEIEDE